MSRITDAVGLALGLRRILKAAKVVYGDAISERLGGLSIPLSFPIPEHLDTYQGYSYVESDLKRKEGVRDVESDSWIESNTFDKEPLQHEVHSSVDAAIPMSSPLEKRVIDRESLAKGPVETFAEPDSTPSPVLQSSRVPSSRIERLFHYGGMRDLVLLRHTHIYPGLALGVGAGIAGEAVKRATGVSNTGIVALFKNSAY